MATFPLVGRLGRNPEQLVNYDQIIHSQLKEGFIEKVENPYRLTGTLHYNLITLLLKKKESQPR